MPEKYQKSSDGGPFLRSADYSNKEQDQVVLVFLSEHGKCVLEKYKRWQADGTFSTCPGMHSFFILYLQMNYYAFSLTLLSLCSLFLWSQKNLFSYKV
ncbi:MAG TPA: hypothetical protein DDE71_10280 [Tenacibaculum sp.]|nr:hypothetical protein [Tenacibaculum sp.]